VRRAVLVEERAGERQHGRVDVERDDVRNAQARERRGEDAGARADVERARDAAVEHQRLDLFEARPGRCMLARPERHAGLDHQERAVAGIGDVPRRCDEQSPPDRDGRMVVAEDRLPVDGGDGCELDCPCGPRRVQARELAQVGPHVGRQRIAVVARDVRFELHAGRAVRPDDVVGEDTAGTALDEEVHHGIRRGRRHVDPQRDPLGGRRHRAKMRGQRDGGQPPCPSTPANRIQRSSQSKFPMGRTRWEPQGSAEIEDFRLMVYYRPPWRWSLPTAARAERDPRTRSCRFAMRRPWARTWSSSTCS
jgi:hypothetical protein